MEIFDYRCKDKEIISYYYHCYYYVKEVIWEKNIPKLISLKC